MSHMRHKYVLLQSQLGGGKWRGIVTEARCGFMGDKYARVIVDHDRYDEVVRYIKKNRPRALTREEKMDILMAQARLRYEHYLSQQKAGPGQKVKSANATQTVMRQLGRAKPVVLDVWSSFWREQELHALAPPSNKNVRPSLVPDVSCVTTAMQTFVRERRQQRERTVARDVLHFLIEKQFIYVDNNDTNEYSASLRSVQRFLKRKGYKRGENSHRSYHLSTEHVTRRDLYVCEMVAVLARKGRVVYMDESYVHKNYCRHHDTLYDPNDEQDLQVRKMHKGERYCFIAAMISADESVPVDERRPDQRAHVMNETIDIFKGGKRQPKDYHGMFNHAYFVKWMAVLLAALSARGIVGATIVMDNASYHCKLPDDTPKGNWKKSELERACKDREIAYESTDVKSVLWTKLKPHIKQHTMSVIYAMAASMGHRVLYTPPYHSDLQPIETVWAIIKGEVGRHYTVSTTMATVLTRLEAAFGNLDTTSLEGCIRKSTAALYEIYNHIKALDDVVESSDSGDEGSSSSESDCEDSE
jgi:transposase